jgi:DNA-binding NarL/FixJ family response regulator
VAADYDETVNGATAANPQVLVTDIRMPPTFQREGIDAAQEVRKRHPGMGIVVLSQRDEELLRRFLSSAAGAPCGPGRLPLG